MKHEPPAGQTLVWTSLMASWGKLRRKRQDDQPPPDPEAANRALQEWLADHPEVAEQLRLTQEWDSRQKPHQPDRLFPPQPPDKHPAT